MRLQVATDLALDGLIVIGGDDSNTNAAFLAEYFATHGSTTRVVGCVRAELEPLYASSCCGIGGEQ